MFGCHAALVLRRLRRLCEREYRAHPVFVVTSATIANPEQHVRNLLGARPRLACTMHASRVARFRQGGMGAWQVWQ